jgi:hypothetical protein
LIFVSSEQAYEARRGVLSFRGHCPIIFVSIFCQDDLTPIGLLAVEKGRVNGTLQRLLERWSTRGCERFWRIKETMMPEGSVGEYIPAFH